MNQSQKLIRDIFLDNTNLNENVIDMICGYSDPFIFTSHYEIKNKQITVIKELDSNRLVLGLISGEVCVYNTLDKTIITKKIISNHRKKYISALCVVPGQKTNKVLCGLSKTNHMLLWDFEFGNITKIDIDNSGCERFVKNIYIKNDIIMCVDDSSHRNNEFVAHILNLNDHKHITEFYVHNLTKNNEKFFEINITYNNTQIFDIELLLNHKLLGLMEHTYFVNEVIPIDEKRYIIMKKYNIIFKDKEKLYKMHRSLIKECAVNVLYIKNHIVVFESELKIYSSGGILIQIIVHDEIDLIEKYQNGLIIVDRRGDIFIYK